MSAVLIDEWTDLTPVRQKAYCTHAAAASWDAQRI